MTKKVLSIDLDYIMGPTIELYNGIYWDSNPLTRWEGLFANSDFDESHFYIDQAALLYCYDVFIKGLKNCSSVSFGYDHDAILYRIKDLSDIEVINIDHHDDVMSGNLEDDLKYGEEDDTGERNNYLKREYYYMYKHDRVCEGNWGSWLHAKGKLKSFTWIHNDNSANLQRDDYNFKLLGDKYNSKRREDYTFEDYNFDHIFICLSPQYVPKSHWHYFRMFMIAFEEFTGKKVDLIEKQRFEFEVRYDKVTDMVTSGKVGILDQIRDQMD